MKTHHRLLAAVAAVSLSTAARSAVVFQDDFSEADGTVLNGKAPDIGSIWSVTNGGSLAVNNGRVDTSGAARTAFGGFTSALGAGQTLTLSYDTFSVAGNNSFAGYEGISLYAAGQEKIFTGSPNGINGYGVDGSEIGGVQSSSDNTPATTVTFTYQFDTGAWTFATASGANLSGTGTAGMALDALRIANGSGGDIAVDNLTVSVVPEPATAGVLGLAGLGLLLRRRK